MKRILRKRVHEKSIVFILIFSIIISVLGTDTGCAAANASENYLPLELLQFEDRRKDNVINAYDDTAIICELYGIDYYEDNRIPGQEQDNNYNQLDCLYDKDGNLIEIAKPLNNQKVNRQYSTLEIIQKLPDIIHKVALLFDFDYEYKVSNAYPFDENRQFIVVSRILENGIINNHQSIKMCIDLRTLELVVAHKFNYEPNVLHPVITEQDAISIANKDIEIDKTGAVLSSITLTYVRPEKYCIAEERLIQDYCNLSYRLEYNDGANVVIIDAVSGEVIGHDILMGDGAKSFVIKESTNSTAYNYNSNLSTTMLAVYYAFWYDNLQRAQAGFASLGYSVTNNNLCSGDIYSDVYDWVHYHPSAYALYINCHGTSSFLSYHIASHTILNLNEVVGNWHFVYLDACNTAANTGWAQSFHIYGYPNRAYLGWSNTVYLSNTHEFNTHFWDLLNGVRTVQNAAVIAAGRVDGDGTTPIRFWGDTTYNGESWS